MDRDPDDTQMNVGPFLRCALIAGQLSAVIDLVHGQTCTSVADGELFAPTSWDCGCLPQSCDTLVIAHALAHSGNVVLAPELLFIEPSGSLSIAGVLDISSVVQCDGALVADTLVLSGQNLHCNGNMGASDLRLRSDTSWNHGTIVAEDTLEIGLSSIMMQQGFMGGGYGWVRGQLYNQDTSHFTLGMTVSIFINSGSLSGDGAYGFYNVFENLPGASVDVDSLFIFNSDQTNQGTIATDSTFYVGNSFVGADLLNTSGALILCRKDFYNYGTLHGAGHLCITGHAENHGALNGIIDVCDATPGMAVPPYLDVNDGTFSGSLNYCAAGYCASLRVSDLAAPQIEMRPNPVADQLLVSTPVGHMAGSFMILDGLGRIALQGLVSGDRTFAIDVTGIIAGQYTVVVYFTDRSVAAAPLTVLR